MKTIGQLLEEYDAAFHRDDCPACGGTCEFPEHGADADPPAEHEARRLEWLTAWLRGIRDEMIAECSHAASAALCASPEQCTTRDMCVRAVCELHEVARK